jgi:hypothetical protein
LIAFAATTRAADAPPAVGKTGEQMLKFTQRSPLSAPKLMAPRLGEKKLEPDYDLASQEFFVWVPDSYKPAEPHGILLLLNYKPTSVAPEAVLPIFKERKLIFVAPFDTVQPTWVKVGLCLDAVHNLKKQYTIDENRIYLFDFDHSADGGPENRRASAGQLLAICYADVITGSFHQNVILAWRPIKAPKGVTYPAFSATPPAAQLGLARTHPFVVSHPGQNDEYWKLQDRFAQQEFRLWKRIEVTGEQAHYPLYTTDWVGEVLKYFDDNAPRPKAKPGAASAPATKPPTIPPIGKPPAK